MRRPLSYVEDTRSFRISVTVNLGEEFNFTKASSLTCDTFVQVQTRICKSEAGCCDLSECVCDFFILKMLSLTNTSHGQPSVRLQFSLCQKVTSEMFLCLSLLLLLNRLNMINERVNYKIKKLPVLQTYLWLCVIVPHHLKYAHRTLILGRFQHPSRTDRS